MWKVYTAVAAATVALSLFAAAESPATAKQGREVFEKRCTGCHSLDKAKVGPPLRHVFARNAASDAKFPYSDALKKSAIKWDASSLDKWLTDPDTLVPDNDMSFRLSKVEERAAVVAYLRELSGQ